MLQEKIEKAMLEQTRRKLVQMKGENLIKISDRWPSNWEDIVHGGNGGNDMLGRRPQDGRLRLSQGLEKLAFADGHEWAQVDVSGVELDQELAKRAREVKMTWGTHKC